MLDWILIFSGIICLLVGLAGSVVPMLPGPPLSYAAMLLLHFTDRVQFTASQLLWWLAVVVVLTVLDYVVPMLGSKYIGGSRWGTWGCLVGTLLGLFFLPWGIIVGRLPRCASLPS